MSFMKPVFAEISRVSTRTGDESDRVFGLKTTKNFSGGKASAFNLGVATNKDLTTEAGYKQKIASAGAIGGVPSGDAGFQQYYQNYLQMNAPKK